MYALQFLSNFMNVSDLTVRLQVSNEIFYKNIRYRYYVIHYFKMIWTASVA